jgi:nitrous oxide reductase accessory protein NosL
MNKNYLASLIILMLCIPAAVFAEKDAGRHSCKVCGMYIDQYEHTSAVLTLKNGKKLETCGVSDMIRIINDQGGPDAFSSIEVHDWKSRALIPAAGAVYVIGSRLIPDMTPNIIAFEHKEDAEAFRAREGGEILNFTQALLSISPMMMTMPTRIKTAVLSPKGALGVGVNYMHMTMERVKLGSESIDPLEFVGRPGQMMAPKKMTTDAEMLMVNYSITDNLTMGVNASYYDKTMETYTMGGKAIQTTKNDGFGDVDVTFRYNCWKNVYYSKFLTLLVGTTLPTGDFKSDFIAMPGLQNGIGAFTFTGGLLYSHRYKDFWFHYMASYTGMLENGDDYKFGDQTRLGFAIHYTPNYNVMAGIEMDAAYQAKDKYLDANVDNTGGFRSNLAAVGEWKFFTAFGGNFSVRASGGIPIYEDINHYRVGQSEKVKLGGGYFTTGTINFSKRLSVL